ncbi:DNA (cytosine-5-)-methyltransferase [Streptomyces sp. S1A]|uniref:DNA cytosine methyltransferase n=1 Tax=Streptomyces sp. ICN903 TaxID=2964654 RepID=UPI001EDA6CAB|nr:DNA (cytosine-5-)-methyltransferase [Streptomyces sp. ICN903]MCG3040456.1 DNA (cytosine-5-)-methyltransferase [Streptomyces sp. ICN903]
MSRTESTFSSVEICAGAGGQALGLHNAGFRHLALVEIDNNACNTLRHNVRGKPGWEGCKILQEDLTQLKPEVLAEKSGLGDEPLDLFAGGVPCPPFSAAGRQLGRDDERDLFPKALELVRFLQPRAVMIENVRGLVEPAEKFRDYREEIIQQLVGMGYVYLGWRVLEARDYGVPQLRPRAILVAMQKEYAGHFQWPNPESIPVVTVAKALAPTMRKRFGSSPEGKAAYKRWYEKAKAGVAPTLVGGSKKHGGADLGPTRAKKAWRKLGIDAMGVANEPEEMKDPVRDLYSVDREGIPIGPKLTVTQAAVIQGFPTSWKFTGRKTAAYRQVGNAFPPPVAQAVGTQIIAALEAGTKEPCRDVAEVDEVQNARLFELSRPAVPLGPEPVDRSSDLERAIVG